MSIVLITASLPSSEWDTISSYINEIINIIISLASGLEPFVHFSSHLSGKNNLTLKRRYQTTYSRGSNPEVKDNCNNCIHHKSQKYPINTIYIISYIIRQFKRIIFIIITFTLTHYFITIIILLFAYIFKA